MIWYICDQILSLMKYEETFLQVSEYQQYQDASAEEEGEFEENEQRETE